MALPIFIGEKMAKHILSCSFGKDSIATALLALQHGEPLDELVYCEVMFNEEISGELPEHNRFIHETAILYFEQRGIPTRVLRSEKTYLSCFYHVVTRGKTKGMLSGFPLSGRCTIQRDCKLPPIKAYQKALPPDTVQYIGIAADEPKRLARLKPGQISLLDKYHVAEPEARSMCAAEGLLSPLYDFTKRGGCWFCPNASISELRHLYRYHPELWQLMLYLRFTKARFYIVDPENEYAPLVQELGGEVVNISVDSSTYFNPLDFKPDKSTDIPPYVAKAEFVLSLCEQIMKKENVLPGDRSLIDRALRSIYKPLIESKYTAPCPTIKDLWAALNSQGDNRSKELALALEIFATGSMQVFAQPTNVDMSNRLICFNIQSLGEQLKPVAMLSMLEYINTAVMSNERNDPKAATWVYFDEIYLLLRDSLSANFLYTSWKRFRKYNAYATGITQNVQDCLTNDTAYAMLANSEFVVMLRQTKDIDSVVELYGLSEPQRKYLLLAQPGEGIIKMGNSLIPFNNPQPKDTKTYKLLTTKPGEME